MKLERDGIIIADIGLSMVKTPECLLCLEHKSLMYGVWPRAQPDHLPALAMCIACFMKRKSLKKLAVAFEAYEMKTRGQTDR